MYMYVHVLESLNLTTCSCKACNALADFIHVVVFCGARILQNNKTTKLINV